MGDEKFEYFLSETNKRLDRIERKLEMLISFRMMLVGASITVSALVSIGITIVFGR
jgi:tetrahydromethanopterin S-methyltransferase subunit G